MSMPAYEDDAPTRRWNTQRRQLPTPTSSTDLFLAAILEEVQAQGRQLAEVQDELVQSRTDLALMRAALPPRPASLDVVESEAPSGATERTLLRRKGSRRR